jgi:Xaa-Pro aminopeptidase
MNAPYADRLNALCVRLRKADVSASLVACPADWRYLTGFTGDSGFLLVVGRSAVLFTDGRYTFQARSEGRNVSVVSCQGPLLGAVSAWLNQNRIHKIGFDPEDLTVAQFRTLRHACGSAVAWKPLSGTMRELRSVKDGAEIAQMRRAAALAGDVMEHLFGFLKPGVRELEVAAELDYQMRKRGASGPAFEAIVASGPRSALPHARPTAKRLKKNELVVLDLGAILGGYCSDLTRTAFLGRAPKRIREWYMAVHEAQAAGVEVAREGVPCGDVDLAARRVLAGRGLDKYFIHSTGHGIGLEVHEWPRLANGQKQGLRAGQVVTIEPGVYVRGIGGIRIEDEVLICPSDCEFLTRVPRDLVEL